MQVLADLINKAVKILSPRQNKVTSFSKPLPQLVEVRRSISKATNGSRSTQAKDPEGKHVGKVGISE